MRIRCSLFFVLGSCSIVFYVDPDSFLEQTDIRCSDGIDNDDIDGADCDDPKCANTAPCSPCGDGDLDPGEACDDGNLTAEDGCDPNCQLPGCGNGFLAPGEVCLSPAGDASINATSTRGGLALGDFQGDGLLDLAVGDFDHDKASVVLTALDNNGALTFTPLALPAMSSLVPDVAAGDLNEDGLDDFVTPIKFSHAIGVFTSQTIDFSIQEFATSGPPTVDEPFGVAIADMDQDGDLDVTTSNFLSNNVAIFLNEGGAFDPATILLVSISPGSTPERMALGDINGDGIPDIVTGNTGSSDLSVVLSNGPLSYGPVLTPSFSGRPEDLAMADINKDGLSDVVVADTGLSRVITFAGSSTGLNLLEDLSLVQAPFGVSLADIDKDGDVDAVAGTFSEQVLFFLNSGDGTLVEAQPVLISGATAAYVAVGDLNKDGAPDLAVSDITNSKAHFFLNQP